MMKIRAILRNSEKELLESIEENIEIVRQKSSLENSGNSIGIQILIESMSSVRNGIAQFILSRWDEQIFRWYLVQITTEDNLVIEEWENPPDLYHVSSPRILA